MQIGNYKTQISFRLKWYWMRIQGRYDYPKPCWYYPTDGWISDPKEIENALRLDDAFEVRTGEKK